MSKSSYEIAGDIVIAWIKAKTDVTVAGAGSSNDRGIPTKEEVVDFYRTVYKTIHTINQ